MRAPLLRHSTPMPTLSIGGRTNCGALAPAMVAIVSERLDTFDAPDASCDGVSFRTQCLDAETFAVGSFGATR